MNITSAKYIKPVDDNNNIVEGSANISISAVINGVPTTVPLSDKNRHYNEIQRLVAAGELTIAEAE
jgi:hypothetical protein